MVRVGRNHDRTPTDTLFSATRKKLGKKQQRKYVSSFLINHESGVACIFHPFFPHIRLVPPPPGYGQRSDEYGTAHKIMTTPPPPPPPPPIFGKFCLALYKMLVSLSKYSRIHCYIPIVYFRRHMLFSRPRINKIKGHHGTLIYGADAARVFQLSP